MKNAAVTGFALAMTCALSAIGRVQAGGKDPTPSEAPSSSMVLVYSKDASDSLQGSCHDEGRNTLCDLTEVWIVPPNVEAADEQERTILQAYKQDPDKTKKELAEVATQLKAIWD